LGLKEATAANVVEMVGTGPFITLPLLIAAMRGPHAVLGWLVGALLAVCDGLVWAELGAAMPGAGGSYLYLREAFGRAKLGQMMGFLFVWMILFTAPLSAASGGIGFAEYLRYLAPNLTAIQVKLVAIAVIVAVVVLCYRDIRSVGRLSLWLMYLVLGTIGLVIVSGLFRIKLHLLAAPPQAFSFTSSFLWGLGQASLIAIYDIGGYNNVCYLGGEVREPTRNIPRAIIISIVVVTSLYFLMTISILGTVPWQTAAQSQHVVADFMQIVWGRAGGQLLTALILAAAFASVFALTLGQSRIPYAAAVNGQFFRIFARLHPRGRFPHVSLLVLGILSALFCLFNLEKIIQVLIVIQIFILCLPQILAVALLRARRDIERPFEMWLYPWPAVVAAALWVLVLISTGWKLVAMGAAVLAIGVALYLVRARLAAQWPFAAAAE
jgi:amino acid transporter